MNFEIYFVSLLQKTGSEKIILVRDDAASPRTQERRNKKKMAKESIADHGPPRVPFRKDSSDTLVSLARGNKTHRTEQLKKFFDEVAPGFTAKTKARREEFVAFAEIDTKTNSSRKSCHRLNCSLVSGSTGKN
jgi:hypothetical protein